MAASAKASRAIPEETALALTYNGGTYAVMMGTPQNLEDFADRIQPQRRHRAIARRDLVAGDRRLDDGIELRMWLAERKGGRLSERRRHIAGPTGCGLCGIDSIAEAVRPAAIVAQGRSFSPRELMTAMARHFAVATDQHRNPRRSRRGVLDAGGGIVALREDVGRHNALDKLAGALAQAKTAASEGMVLLTSRVSVEMVQKTAAMGAPVMVAVSAPTALAVRMAEAAGITLVAIARADGFEIFTHPDRITSGARRRQGTAHVAYRQTGWSTWPIKSANSSKARGTTRRCRALPTTSANSGIRGCARRSSPISTPAAPASTRTFVTPSLR